MRYVRANSWLRILLLSFAAVNLLIAGPAVTLVPVLAEARLQGSATTLGLLAAYGAGAASPPWEPPEPSPATTAGRCCSTWPSSARPPASQR
ncbi:hypothetical protein ACGRHY_25985 [Streptomyces sp. HK10]|uniref:hypothetical protein n=1 Tax=Streptomyces sp. HK10 TaxID=3373255 RepID=UPI0037479A07